MKRLIIFLILPYCFLSPIMPKDSANAKAETSTYAKATTNCTLYKDAGMANELSNIYFIVPETYFVIILDKVSDDCYKVQYDKFIGYVDASTIIVATFIPIVKTLENITLDIKDTSGTQIWSSPSTDGKILTTITAGFKNIKYIASSYGTIPSGGESNLWYYVSFTPSANSTNVYEGYIYSENTTNLSEIIANAEANPEPINNSSTAENILYLSSSLKSVIIVIITIPIIIFILIILYKSHKKFKDFANKRNNNQESQIENEETNFNNQYVYSSFKPAENFAEPKPQNNLKKDLEKMRNVTFIKKPMFGNKTEQAYPTFPDYNPDDDIL